MHESDFYTTTAVWDAGHRRDRDAVPHLIQHLQGADPKNTKHVYALVWALGRCGDPSAIAPMRARMAHITDRGVQRMIAEAIRMLSVGEEAGAFIERQRSTLPEVLKAALAAPTDPDQDPSPEGAAARFAVALEDMELDAFCDSLDLYTLYLAESAETRPAFLDKLAQIPLAPGYFRALRYIFKGALYREDAQVYALLARRFDTQLASGSSAASVKHRDRAWSIGTRVAMRRSIWRTLRRLGESDDAGYVTLATELLLAFDQDTLEALPDGAHVRGAGQPLKTRLVRFDAYAFNHVLMGTRLSATRGGKPGTGAWGHQVSRALDAQANSNARLEPFAHLWDQQPEALVRIIKHSDAPQVLTFAARALRANFAYCAAMPIDDLLELLDSDQDQIVALAIEALGQRDASDIPRRGWTQLARALAVLIRSRLEDDRAMALGWLDRHADQLLRDRTLVVALATHPDAAIRRNVGLLLRADPPTSSRQGIFTRGIVGHLLQLPGKPQRALVFDAADLINGALHEGLETVSLRDVIKLLEHTSGPMRKLGGLILRALPDATFLDSTDQLFGLITHDNATMREAIRPVVARLAREHAEFADAFCRRLLDRFTDPTLGGGPYNIHFTPNPDKPDAFDAYTVTRKRQSAPDDDGGLVELSSSARNLIGANIDDQTSDYADIGFTFTFGGTDYTQFCADSNGWMAFEGHWGGSYSNYNAWNRNNAVGVFPWWTDLKTADDGHVRTDLLGEPGERVRVIQWRCFASHSHSRSHGVLLTFQCCLHEGSNAVVLRFGPREVFGSPSWHPTMACGAALNTSRGTRGNVRDFFGTNGSPPGTRGPFRTDLASNGDQPHYPGVANCGLGGSDGSDATLEALFADIAQTLLSAFSSTLKRQDIGIVRALLAHPYESVQVFGADIVMLHDTPAEAMPTELFHDLVGSRFSAVRLRGAELLAQLPDEALTQHSALLVDLALKAESDVRAILDPIIRGFASRDAAFGLRVLHRLAKRGDEKAVATVRLLLDLLADAVKAEPELPVIALLADNNTNDLCAMALDFLEHHKPWDDLPGPILASLLGRKKTRTKARLLLMGLPDQAQITHHQALLYELVEANKRARGHLQRLASTYPEAFGLDYLLHLLAHDKNPHNEALESLLVAFPKRALLSRIDVVVQGCLHLRSAISRPFISIAKSLVQDDPAQAAQIALDLIPYLPTDAKASTNRAYDTIKALLDRLPHPWLVGSPQLPVTLAFHPHEASRQLGRRRMVILTKAAPGSAPELTRRLVQGLFRKEAFEGAHLDLIDHLHANYAPHFPDLPRKTLWRLLSCPHIDAQEFGAFVLQNTVKPEELSLVRIARLASHDLRAVRETSWAFYRASVDRLKATPEDCLRLLDATWDDSRAFAFGLIRDQLGPEQLTPPLLISICDSVRHDVQRFGRELVTRYFGDEDGPEYLLKLSQHPAPNVELFVTNYLERYASGQPERIATLRPYFARVLCRVNHGRMTKDRVLNFLRNEALANVEAARVVLELLTWLSVTESVGDKAAFLTHMLSIQQRWPELAAPLAVKAIPVRQPRRR